MQLKPNINHGNKSEKKLAKHLGGKQTPASGAANSKGDINLGDIKIEAKSTIKNSLSIKLDWLCKISREAIREGQVPAVSIRYVTENAQPVKYGRWVMIPEDKFKELYNEIS